MSATDDLRAHAKESLSPGARLARKMETARRMDALKAERDEAIAERDAAREALGTALEALDGIADGSPATVAILRDTADAGREAAREILTEGQET